MALENIVQMDISRTALTISTASFANILITRAHSAFPERARRYEDANEVADDFSTDSAAYRAAVAAFNNGANVVFVGRRDATGIVAQVFSNAVASAADDTVYTVAFNESPDVEVLSGSGATVDSIRDKIVEAVNASDAPFTAASTGLAGEGKYSLTCDWAGMSFSCSVDGNQTTSESTAAVLPSETMTDALDAIEAYIDTTDWEWYGLATVERTDTDVTDTATWVEDRPGIYGFRDDDKAKVEDASGSLDLASSLGASGFGRTFGEYSYRPWLFPEVSVMANRLAVDPDRDATTWAHVPSLVGPKPDSLRGAKSTLDSKGYNYVMNIGGQKVHEGGKVVGGEWIDVVVGLDWFKSRTREKMFAAEVTAVGNGSKIPYTNDGVGVLESKLRGQLGIAVGTGLFTEEPAPTIDAPNVRDLDSTTRASRVLPGLKFEAHLQGAIHVVKVEGTVLN